MSEIVPASQSGGHWTPAIGEGGGHGPAKSLKRSLPDTG